MLGTFTKVAHRLLRGIAKSEQPINALALGIATDFVMKLTARFADFTHVAKDHQFAPDRCGQHIDTGTNRVRIGVIGIVENFRTLVAGTALQAPFDAGKRLQPSSDVGHRYASSKTGGGRSDGIARIVTTWNMQGNCRGALGGRQFNGDFETMLTNGTAYIGSMIDTESPHGMHTGHRCRRH